MNDGDGVVTIAPSSPTIDYELPADIPVTTSDASDSTFQEFGWRSFLGLNAPGVGEQISTIGDNVPQWATWSSTVDLIICQQSPTPDGCRCSDGGCDRSGTRFYPSACRQIPDFENYRVLGQVNKADDSFEEAGGDKGKPGSLSGAPVIDRFGNFLRYEILVSPATYDEIISEQLYDQQRVMNRNSDINMSCGTSNYTGGDPANAQMGALVVKVAWMDVTDALASGEIDPSLYHLEQVLVSTPFYRNSDDEATCDVRTMAMVGLHLAHKTTNQPNWIWSTFEHNLNAPDCTGAMGLGNTAAGPNTTCPNSVSVNYNFYGQACNGDASSCASCNAAPAQNGSCANPASPSEGAGFCLDLPPAATAGMSKLCRQVPISGYPEAGTWNSACQEALGSESVWSNYELISSQWATSDIGAGCRNVARMIAARNLSKNVQRELLRPHVNDAPLLANTSMESYERSNCLGCHAKAQFTGSDGKTYSTDLIYFLHLEVSAPAAQTAKYKDEIASGGDSAGGDNDGCQMVAPHDGNLAWLLLLPAALLPWRRRSR